MIGRSILFKRPCCTVLAMFVCSVTGTIAMAEGVASSVAESSQVGSFMARVSVSDFTFFHGPSLTTMSSPYSVDASGKATTAYNINFDNDLTVAYKLDSDIQIGPEIPFVWVPVMGQKLLLGDLGIKAFHRNTVSQNGFSFTTSVAVQAPTSSTAQARNMLFSVKTSPYARYDIQDSRFSLGIWTEAKTYFGVDSGKSFKLWGAPYVAYKISPKLSLNFQYEVEADHFVGMPGMALSTYYADFSPGIVWNISQQVLLNPFVQIYTTRQVDVDHMAFGAIVVARII